MKGNPELISMLNDLLADEFTAIHQYRVHEQMARNYNYTKLAEYIKARIDDEKEHSEILIKRIIFLEGMPIVSTLRPISIGQEVPQQFTNDHNLEIGAIKKYNDVIEFAEDVAKDNATRDILAEILTDEDRHTNDIEAYQKQIEQMTLQNWLSTQN